MAADVGPAAAHRAFLAEGRFMLQRARASGRCFFPPRTAEPGTGDLAWDWVEACGRGTVYATTVVRARTPEESYNVALVDLAEGPRVMTRVEGVPPDAVRIGMAVVGRVESTAGSPLLVFRPAP